jgi:hypothetical protein
MINSEFGGKQVFLAIASAGNDVTTTSSNLLLEHLSNQVYSGANVTLIAQELDPVLLSSLRDGGVKLVSQQKPLFFVFFCVGAALAVMFILSFAFSCAC